MSQEDPGIRSFAAHRSRDPRPCPLCVCDPAQTSLVTRRRCPASSVVVMLGPQPAPWADKRAATAEAEWQYRRMLEHQQRSEAER